MRENIRSFQSPSEGSPAEAGTQVQVGICGVCSDCWEQDESWEPTQLSQFAVSEWVTASLQERLALSHARSCSSALMGSPGMVGVAALAEVLARRERDPVDSYPFWNKNAYNHYSIPVPPLAF